MGYGIVISFSCSAVVPFACQRIQQRDNVFQNTHSPMGRQRISDELKQLVVSMSLQGIPASEIHEYTGMSVRSIKRFRSIFRRTGTVVSPPPTAAGRPRTLTAIHVKVSMHYPMVPDVVSLSQFLCNCVERQPDIALMELQTELREACNIEVSLSTIMRSLKREGYTMKTVCHDSRQLHPATPSFS